MRKSELTEEEKDIYIRLFYPLSKQQKNNVYKIWKDNINEDIYIKYKKLENYCDKNDCDLMMALFQIYDSYNYFYFSFDSKLGIDDYINNKSLSDSLRGINSLCLNNEFNKKIMNVKDDTLMHHFELLKKKPIDKESDINLHVAMEKYLKKQPQEQKINEYRVYHVFEERKKIEDYILELISERRENPEKYINDNIKTKVRINKKSLFNNPYNDLEKQMYIPYDKTYSNKRNYANLNNDETIKENQETITQSNTSLQSDLCVGCYDAKRTKELYDECCNVVFKYCNLEDFVNSLNNPEECNLIVKYQSRLYVLYNFFDDFFGEEGEEKIEKLNEKFGITERRYGQKKFRYGSTNTTTKQKEFYDILVEI